MLGARKDTDIAQTSKSEGLLAIEMLRSAGEDQSLAAVGARAPVDAAFGKRNIQSAKRIHDLRKDVHVGNHVMIHVQAEINLEGARQKTRSIVRAAIGIGSVELLMVCFQVALD